MPKYSPRDSVHSSTRLVMNRHIRSKLPRVAADSLTDINNEMKCLFVLNRSCIHKGFYVFPQVGVVQAQNGSCLPCVLRYERKINRIYVTQDSILLFVQPPAEALTDGASLYQLLEYKGSCGRTGRHSQLDFDFELSQKPARRGLRQQPESSFPEAITTDSEVLLMITDNMPYTKKESPEDGFHFFCMDVEKQVQERGAAFISEMAASMWEHMTPDERWGYEEQARNKEHSLSHVDFRNEFRPRRTYCARIERVLNQANRQNSMFREIEATVRALKHQNSLKTHPFYLVHVNYYCKDSSGRYLGCEIALAEFSFVDGVTKALHAFMNPGEIPLGYAFQAFKHATETHLLPLPPDGFGSESEHQEILSNIRAFLMREDRDETNLPPLYTSPGDIEAVESVLCQLNERPGQHMNAGRDNFRVYSVCKLFHELRNASMGVPSEVILPPNFLDPQELSNTDLECAEGISCKFHEQLEATRYCSLWHVLSWSILVMDECCGPLAIEIVPGKHCDFSTYLAKRARAKHLIRCCNQKIYSQETTLMQSKPVQQVSSVGFRPWLRRPVRPLRRPRDPIEVNLMRALSKQ
ncbi:hypothetical protein B7P43_G09258 [Cryptotermes secundus]|uniref:Maelstrom domain-containing protein n=1 Tax=Cryptotermes secundus TaxID=105785 RepID=A0A2J7QTC0_9NEOP|nr:hypothetical protein B7P43_G09258 [Cryptotermes secundus]